MLEKMTTRWHHLSIPYKVSLLCAAFILPMLILICGLFSEFYFYHRQTDQILAEYSNCSDFSAAIRQETEQMEKMAYCEADEKEISRCKDVREKSDRCLQSLIRTDTTDNKNIRCMKQVIVRALAVYRRNQDVFLQTLQQGKFEQQVFSEMKKDGNYLCSYADDLTAAQLENGKSSYLELGRQLANRNIVVVAMILLCTLGMTCGITLLMHSIVAPVRRLRDAAMQVARGHYDEPDLQYSQTDEIGQLASSFHQMKHQISRTIHALEAEAKMEKDLRRHQEEEARLNQLVERSRFAQLQSQINPHFLFNTLQSIANMAELEDAAVSEDMILRLAKFFRYTLETDDAVVTLSRELDLLRDYISLQEIRFGDRIVFEMDCDPACDHLPVPKFIVQPLVENAIVHGMRQRAGGGRIRITTRKTEDGCRIVISDNGCGFQTSAPVPAERMGRHSIGLQNIAQRIETMGGSLRLFSVPGLGTAARIYIHERESFE
ncbi:MAG TPA: hypothetical protein DDX51_01535 [Clostridiales bacterium]|nr:hypothetical protein [Clostridiales bacterium]